MPFIVNPKPSVMTFGYEKCRCEFTMQSVQEITKLSITKVFPLNTLCESLHNAFMIMGRARQALRRNGRADLIEQFTKECTSGSYDNLLATCARYFVCE